MALTFGEAAKIEQALAEVGELEASLSLEDLLAPIGAWFSSEQDRGAPICDNESFALLCDYARRAEDGRVKSLAVGALRLARERGETNRVAARFTIKFALQRIRARGADKPRWGVVPLSDDEEANARTLFDAALGDTSYSDEDLVAKARRFTEKYGRGGHLFGRLASDLLYLVKVMGGEETVKDEGAVAKHKEIARAALTYFYIEDDAISDDLGLVGFLDDAFIIQEAIGEILPGRNALIDVLDGILRRWPFVPDVVFEAEGTSYPVSEFLVVNASLLLDAVREQEEVVGTALVVHETNLLPFVLGFMKSLAEVASRVNAETDAFTSGERLINRETDKEVIFNSYGRLVDVTTFEACSQEAATHFRFRANEPREGRSAVQQTRTIGDIRSFRRSGKREGTLKGGSLSFDRENLDMGPLDRLFRSPTPIILPDQRGCVVVVSPIEATHKLANILRMFNYSLAEVLPMGKAALRDGQIQSVAWTQREAGGKPMLVVVKKAADACVVAEQMGDDCLAVVATVRPGSRDATNLGRIRHFGIPVVAIVETRDDDSQEYFENLDFKFWSWGKPLVSSLHWPDQSSASVNPVAGLDQRIRFRSESNVSIIPLEIPGLTETNKALTHMRDQAEVDEDIQLNRFVADCWPVFVRICRLVVPLDLQTKQGLRQRIKELAETLDENKRVSWSSDVVTLASAALEGLEHSLDSLIAQNPKFTAISEWCACHENGEILCQKEMADALLKHTYFWNRNIDYRHKPGSWFPRVLIPSWLGKYRMDRFLAPPVGRETELILYEPERAWYSLFERRAHLRLEALRRRVEARPAFPSLLSVAPARVTEIPMPSKTEIDPDVVLQKLRRTEAARSIGPGGDEAVEARLIHFLGGYWGAYTEGHRVYTVTHLLGAEVHEDGDDADIVTTTSWELRHGDLVLVMKGSDRDALREAVDSKAPSGTRECSGEWRRALVRYLERGHSMEQLVTQLKASGCPREGGTVRGWIENEQTIAPQQGGPDIEAIVEATGDEELKNNLTVCINAVDTLRRLHQSVAHELAQRVLQEARQWLESGVEPDELVEIDDRIVLVTVELVDDLSMEVARTEANRLRRDK